MPTKFTRLTSWLTPDYIAHVIRHLQRSRLVQCHAPRPSKRITLFGDKVGQPIDYRFGCRLAAAEGYEGQISHLCGLRFREQC